MFTLSANVLFDAIYSVAVWNVADAIQNAINNFI